MKKLIRNTTVQDSLICLGLGIVFGIYNIYKTITLNVKVAWMMSPYLFPLLLTVFILIVSVMMFFEGKRQVDAETAPDTEAKTAGEKHSGSVHIGQAVFMVVLVIGYDYLMRYITFIPATMIALALMMLLLGERNFKKIAIISVASPLVLYLIFKTGLNVKLP